MSLAPLTPTCILCVCVYEQVQAKESMMAILAVCMFGTSATLEGMNAALHSQVKKEKKMVGLIVG